MTGGAGNGGAVLVLWAVAVGGGVVGIGAALSRWRWRLPKVLRVALGYPCEGDPVRCFECGATEPTIVEPTICGGFALCCGECGSVLETDGVIL